MSWFIFSMICVFAWGFADLFYKIGTDENDQFSQYKITICVGIIMGIVSLILIPFSNSFFINNEFTLKNFFILILKYSPASISYIVSMFIGYIGLRYLEISIISPIQNASGAFSMIVMLIYFTVFSSTKNYTQFLILDYIGTTLIVIGLIVLAIVEKSFSNKQKSSSTINKFGALALLFPLLYCLFDTIGTAADGIILSDQSFIHLSEIDVTIIYGLTFFFISIICWIFLFVKSNHFFNPFQKKERPKMLAAIFEETGQIFYIFAMSKNPVLAAPMVASYCIISVILSHIIIKEKLFIQQYLCIIFVIIGILLLGISESIKI